MSFSFTIDESTAQESAAWFDPLPPDWYPVVADEVSLHNNKAGTGRYIKCRFVVTDGKYKGRKLFVYFNVEHQNKQTEEIGRGQLSAFMVAVGIRTLNSPNDVKNKPLMVRVKLRPSRNGDEENAVNGYRAIQNAPQVQVQMPQQMQMPQAPVVNQPVQMQQQMPQMQMQQPPMPVQQNQGQAWLPQDDDVADDGIPW